MKLMRVGPVGTERPALIGPDSLTRDLSGVIRDFDADALSPAGLARLAALDLSSLPLVAPGQRVGPPVPRPANFVAIGLNYADHAAEAGQPIPQEPVVFLKSVNAYCGPNDDVHLPRGAKKTDWEVELGVVIGTRASYAQAHEAMDHVAGYCVINDVSEREYQLERGGTWDKGKGCDTFGPIGPWLVTRDEVTNPQKLQMWLDLNGQRVQTGSTKTMVFGVAKLISYVSQFMTLEPGDVITTGTPPGVGMGMKPPLYLKKGDKMSLGIEGLGEQHQLVVAFKL